MSLFHFFLPLVCPKLNAPANGTASNYTEMEAPVGATSIFSCDDDYVLIGAAVVTCQENGSWSDKEPECKRKNFVVILLLNL